MQLTHYTDYGLRVLIFLSIQSEERRVTISRIADCFQIPRNHLVKVVHQLGKLNYIQTTRGKTGGLRLARAADQIRIGDVVQKMEFNLDIINCDQPTSCPILRECQLKNILSQAADAFMNVLNQYTIADLQNAPDNLKYLLKIT